MGCRSFGAGGHPVQQRYAAPGSSLAGTPLEVESGGSAFTYYARLRRVKEYVEANYSEAISLAEAADVAGLEPKYFSTFFHEKTGVCFSAWMRQLRVEKALDLMRARNYSITRVSLEVGFGDLRTFERAFKRVTAMTPSEFKRTVRPC